MSQRAGIGVGVHLIVGGYPPGSPAAHDMDYVRLRLLGELATSPAAEGRHTTVSPDYGGLGRWLAPASLLVTYAAGPVPTDDEHADLRAWLEAGGRWLALHGSSGGRAAKVERDGRTRRMMVRQPHHATLGGFFLNHPPVQRFTVRVAEGSTHPLVAGLPASFEAVDELYLIELQDPEHTEVLLTTELEADPSPPGFGFAYDADTSVLDSRGTRALGFVHPVGDGAVAYVALGHTHSPATNGQPFVDRSVTPDGVTPTTFRGVWESDEFLHLVRNGIAWGLADR
ncbi:MAG: ThuA domain-containing protein [Acidimicrobiales bacterium]